MQRRFYIKTAIIITACILLSISIHAQSGILESFEDIDQNFNELSEKLSAKSLFDILLSGIPSFLHKMSHSFGMCVAVLIISTVFSTIKQSFLQSENVFEIIAMSILILCIYPPLQMCFDKVSEHLFAMCGFMVSFIPTGAMLHAASGNTLTSSGFSASAGISVAFLEFLSIYAILPCTKAVCSLTAVGSILKRTNLFGITKAIKSFCLWASGLCFTLFTGIFSLSNLLQSSADSIAIKGLKFGASRFIPIAGGMVSESMKTVISGVSFLKSVTGISGIIFIIYTVIPPFCSILAAKIYLLILSALAKASNQTAAANYIDEICSCINILSALLIGCSLSFIIMLTVFIKTTVVI